MLHSFRISSIPSTYLNSEVGTALDDAWQRLMGENFPTKDVSVSPEELKTWPTLIFQMKSLSGKNSDIASVHGAMAGVLDSEHPEDVLIAFPPSRYMVLNLPKNVYQPRLWMDGKIKKR